MFSDPEVLVAALFALVALFIVFLIVLTEES
jgi:hypothetical protein